MKYSNIQHAHGHNKPLTVLCTYHRMFYAVGTAALCQRHYYFIYCIPCSVVGVVPWAVLLHYYMLCTSTCVVPRALSLYILYAAY